MRIFVAIRDSLDVHWMREASKRIVLLAQDNPHGMFTWYYNPKNPPFFQILDSVINVELVSCPGDFTAKNISLDHIDLLITDCELIRDSVGIPCLMMKRRRTDNPHPTVFHCSPECCGEKFKKIEEEIQSLRDQGRIVPFRWGR